MQQQGNTGQFENMTHEYQLLNLAQADIFSSVQEHLNHLICHTMPETYHHATHDHSKPDLVQKSDETQTVWIFNNFYSS